MKKLFLTSSFAETKTLFPAFAGETKGKKVAFIPTAAIPEEVNFYVKDDREAFESLGIEVITLEITETETAKIKEILHEVDFIFVGGGNTFFLLQELHKSGAFELIKNEVENDKIYIGTSAGSVVASPDINYSKEMDDPSKAPELKDTKGFGFVDFYTVPHVGSEVFKEMAEKIINDYENQLNLMPITNTQAIEVKGAKIEVKEFL